MRILILAALLASCGGPISGVRVTAPAAGPAMTTAKASDPGGIVVLWNRRAGHGEQGLLATSPAELAALWNDVGLEGEPPRVDFGTHVVVGTNFEDGVCQPELVAATVDAAGTLTFTVQHTSEVCILLAVRVARVVAVPRSILPRRFTWRVDGDTAFAFEVAPTLAKPIRPPSVTTAQRERIDTPRGTVALPPPGHIALRELDDGRQIWVAHRAADDISVLTADAPNPRAPGVHFRVGWNKDAHRFSSEHDSRGRAINGGTPLERLAFARLPDDRLAIGDPVELVDGPSVARDAEPELDGPHEPYTDVTPTTFAALGHGKVGVIADDLVYGVDGPPRLCPLPAGKLRTYLSGCPRTAPELVGAPSESRGGMTILHGPNVVRRHITGVDLVIAIGNGLSSRVVEWSLAKPARAGATRSRGTLRPGAIVEGTTRGTTNGFAPSCLERAAQGSPDESWELAVPKTGRYVIELVSKYDGALAVVANGKQVACNDDRNGHYRSSVLSVDLVAKTTVRIVVDGFGGHAGSYRLVVQEQPVLPPLVVGRPVSGTTTGAIDQESHGCYAPAGDHRYTLEIAEAGAYLFRIETPGWAPMLSVVEKLDGFGCYTHRPPLVDTYRLEAGTYFVIVDGSSEDAHGPYMLTVTRCSTDDKEACRKAHR